MFRDRPLFDPSNTDDQVFDIVAPLLVVLVCKNADSDLTTSRKCCNSLVQIFIVEMLERSVNPRAVEKRNMKGVERTSSIGEKASCGQRHIVI